MLTATFWGLVGGAALLVGALLGLYAHASNRVIGIVMAFGSGVLISAVAFELTEEAFRSGGTLPVVLGLVGGSLVFFVGDWLIDRRGGHRRKSPTGTPQQGGLNEVMAQDVAAEGRLPAQIRQAAMSRESSRADDRIVTPVVAVAPHPDRQTCGDHRSGYAGCELLKASEEGVAVDDER